MAMLGCEATVEMRWFCSTTTLLLVLAASSAWSAEHPALAKARALYNAGDFDGAITSAELSRLDAASADASALVIARAQLERYRQGGDVAALGAARDALNAVRSETLAARDRVDLLVGLGQSLFLAEQFGPAGELFDTALSRSSLLPAVDRLQLLDWWASSLDRDAQSRPVHLRGAVFERITRRMEEELRDDPGCAPANYWLAVSARGTGDVDRAWSAAIAGWIRAYLSPSTSVSLRADLDRLVTQALIPERARARPTAEQADALSGLSAEWMLVKEQWK